MRQLIVIGMFLALGLLAAALARLGGTLAQLHALDMPAVNPAEASVLPEAAAPAVGEVASETPLDSGEEAPVSAASGDAHIMRALAADPDFQRAAAELLHDPDPAVQAEARQLLRELGADQSE